MNDQSVLSREIEQYPHLAVLPPGISYLLKTLTDSNVSYTKLAEEIEKFPSITVKIIALANSAWATPVAQITSLRDACSRVGLPLVRNISIALSVSQIFDPARCIPFNPKTYWVSALLTAEAATICASDTPGINADTARLAGLLHNMGLLWLADRKPAEVASAIKMRQTNNIPLRQILLEEHNLDIYNIASMLAVSMELPEIIASTIESCSIKSTRADLLSKNHRSACQLATSVIYGADTNNLKKLEIDNNSQHEKLSTKLPLIKSMAQTLFFNWEVLRQ